MLWPLCVRAQEIDSLFTLYKEAGNSDKVILGPQLQNALLDAKVIKEKDLIDFSSDNAYCDRVLFYEMSLYDFYTHKFEDAVQLSNEALSITPVDSTDVLMHIYNVIGTSSFFLGHYEDAIEANQKQIEYLKLLGDEDGLAEPYNTLAAIYNQLEDYEQALVYNNKAVEIARAKNDANTMRLGGMLGKKAETLINLERFDEAFGVIQEAMVLDSIAERTNFFARDKARMGHVYYKKKRYAEAVAAYRTALELEPGTKNVSRVVMLNHLGISEHYIGDDKEAQQHILTALSISEQGGFDYEKAVSYSYLSDVYAKTDPALALEYFRKYVNLNDSLQGLERQKKFDELTVRFETKEKEDQIALQEAQLERRRHISILLVVLALLLAILCATFARLNAVRKHRNAEQRQYSEQKERLLAVLTHDLKAPVQGQKKVLGYVCKKMDKLSAEDLKSYCTMVRDSNDLLDWQVTNLVQLVTVMREGSSDNKHVFKVAPLIHVCVEEMLPGANMKHITIDTSIDEETMVEGDPNIIKTVLRNLLSNAVKYTGENGEIRLSIAEEGKQYRLFVTDNGVGINEERLSKLFKEELVSARGTADESGNGFGLYACRILLNHVGLDLAAQSSEGQGSTFSFTIKKPQNDK